MTRYLRIDPTSHHVLNAEIWDEQPEEDGVLFVASEAGGVGDVYNPADGSFAPAETPAAPVPAEVSNVQGHAVLIQLNLLDEAQSAITAIKDPTARQLAQLAFDRGAFVRSSPMIAQLSAGLGLSSDQVDQMFRDAEGIVI